jgi:predicted phage terminase large subunit-like protein
MQALADGDGDRLMICLPPGSAKSFYAKLFVAWLSAHGNTNIIGASHTGTYAEKISNEIQTLIRENAAALGTRLTKETAELWQTENGCEYKAAGVGGIITGFRADWAIIDDPVKSREQADSAIFRDRAWDWFNADLRSRAKPNLKIVLIMTRWHLDDLGGRLLESQGERWRLVSLPAQAIEDDPLGRLPGEWLWDGDPAYPYGAELRRQKTEYEQNGAMRDWFALFQQNPVAIEGSLFKVAKIDTLDTTPAGRNVVRSWDLAATAQAGTRDPDWTAGVKLLRTSEGRFVVADVVRLRGGPDEVEQAIVNTAKQDGNAVRIGLPQDPGQAGKQQVLYLTRKLAGYRVESSPETGDKATRAGPVVSQVNVGNFAVVRGAWNRAFLDELAGFPSTAKDDQVDALSRAFSMVGMSPPPMRFSSAFLSRI